MDVEEEDDSEPILEGSELHRYLKNINCDQCFETFSSGKKKWWKYDGADKSDHKQKGHIISKEFLELIHPLLYSKLMLEEDASFLYSLTLSFDTAKVGFKLKTIMWSGGILLVLYGSYVITKCNIGTFYPFLLSSTSLIGVYIKKSYSFSRNKATLNNLLIVLNKIFHCVGRNFSRIKEATSVVVTKSVNKSLTQNVDPVTESFCKRVREEITVLTTDLVLVMLKVIYLAKKTTLFLKKLMPPCVRFNTQFVASLNDEQLGISNFCSEDLTNINLKSLDLLKNIYILMQSEYLKAIGICLTPLVVSTDFCMNSQLFKVLEKDLETSMDILNGIEFQEHYFVCKNKCIQEPNPKNNYLTNGCGKLRLFNSFLRAILLESNNLECFLDECSNVSFEDNIDHIYLNLINFDKMMTDYSKYLKEIITHFQCMKMNSVLALSDNKDVEQMKSDVKETGIHVGHSDFSITDIDKVYLCITDDKNDESGVECSTDDSFEDASPKLPHYVLSELKNALITKKIEFQKRELEAAKRSNIDISKYQNCTEHDTAKLDSYNKSSDNDFFNRKNLKADIIYQNSESSVNSNILPINETCGETISFQKLIAMKAVNTSLKWNNCQSEIVYDEENSDGSFSDDD